MKRLLQIVFSAHGTIGGQQTHLTHIISGLDKSRYEVDVVNWDVPESVAELERQAINVLVVKSRRIVDLRVARKLARHIRKGRYDLVHAHGHRGGMIGRIAAILAGARIVVWTCHVAENKADANPILRSAYAASLRWLGRRTHATVAVSPELRDWLVGVGIDPAGIEVIRNCVDSNRFRPRPAEPKVIASLGLTRDAPIVGTVARLTEQKGLACLLNAARIVLDSRPQTQFVIVGGGPLGKELARQADGLGLTGRVVFAGQRSDIPEVIAAFDIAVVPSLWEGAFSYVPLEMMASRKPLICSDIPHFRHIVSTTDSALMVPTGREDELAAAIIRLLDNPSEAGRIAKNGYDLVRSSFDVSIMQRRMAELYERLLNEEAG